MTTSAAAPTCNTLWIGGDLGPIAAACLSSFVRRGHRVVVYCYEAPRDLPLGVETADAQVVIPSGRIFRHKSSGSYALFSDLFRYELLRLGVGIWIDCDLYCVRPVGIDEGYVFGWEHANSVNGAVLALPKDSPVLEKLVAIFAVSSPVLPWLSPGDQQRLRARRLSGESFGLEELPWGAAGPAALSYLLTEAGLARYARPSPVFYPVPYASGALLLRRGFDLASRITRETLAVHLWNDTLRRHLGKMERGSSIHRLISQGTLFDESLLEASAD